MLIRAYIPDNLSGEYSVEENKINWNTDKNPSSLIINLPDFPASHSFTIKKAYLLLNPIHVSIDTDLELLILTEVAGSDDLKEKDFNLFLSIKIKVKEDIIQSSLNLDKRLHKEYISETNEIILLILQFK